VPNYKDLSSGELQRLASQGDRDAYYWLGKYYSDRGDNQNAAIWWEKAVKELPSNHKCFNQAATHLAFLHCSARIPQANDNEAIRLFELAPSLGPLSKLFLGVLYCNVQGQKNNPSKGIGLVEDAITQFIKEDGNDEYLNYNMCFQIAGIYNKEMGRNATAENVRKAMDYFKKTITRGPGSQEAEVAKKCIENLKRISIEDL